MTFLLSPLIVLLFGITAGEAIKCFQCNSLRDPDCAELGEIYGEEVTNISEASRIVRAAMNSNSSSTIPQDLPLALRHYKECDTTSVGHPQEDKKQPFYFCRKISQTIFARSKLQVVTRSCGWEQHPRLACYQFENKGHEETVCQCFEDGCNHASTLVNLHPLLFLLTFSLSLFFVRTPN